MSILRNRLTQNHQGVRVSAEADAKALIAEQLIRLEDDLRRLKVEFDIFLNGGAKRPPYDTKNRVEITFCVQAFCICAGIPSTNRGYDTRYVQADDS